MIRNLLATAAVASDSLPSTATTIATFVYGDTASFIQNGTLTNLYSQNVVAFEIDFVADTGVPPTPVWELPPPGPGVPGSPPATFSDLNADGLGAFVAGWSGHAPVPLPATLPMLAAAFVAMGALRRRKEAGRA